MNCIPQKYMLPITHQGIGVSQVTSSTIISNSIQEKASREWPQVVLRMVCRFFLRA